MDFKVVGEKRKLELNELEELILDAYKNSILYKERIKIWHNKKILRDFNERFSNCSILG